MVGTTESMHHVDESRSRSLHSFTVCLLKNGAKSIMLLKERHMIAEMCISALGMSQRADKTSIVLAPLLCTAAEILLD